LVDIMPSDNMDDLFDFGQPISGRDASTSALSAAPQFPSRREARAAASGAPSVVSRPLVVSPAASRASEGRPASRKLRRAEIAAMHASAPKVRRKNPVQALATMIVVGGMFALAGIPAYALTDTTATQESDAVGAQSMKVSADATVVAATRDGYRATSSAQLAEIGKDDIRAQNNAEYLLSGARQLGDDYPWYYELSESQGAALSPLNYYYRQCTDFVAWRLNRDAGTYEAPYKWVWSTLTPSGGNASQWGYAWEAHGWPVSKTPIVGSVAWFGWSNHVAYVKAVNADGTVLIEEYNYVPDVYTQRTIPASSVESFLYPPT
jgi:peptidoglycan DL-endopeptidase CwlO